MDVWCLCSIKSCVASHYVIDLVVVGSCERKNQCSRCFSCWICDLCFRQRNRCLSPFYDRGRDLAVERAIKTRNTRRSSRLAKETRRSRADVSHRKSWRGRQTPPTDTYACSYIRLSELFRVFGPLSAYGLTSGLARRPEGYLQHVLGCHEIFNGSCPSDVRDIDAAVTHM